MSLFDINTSIGPWPFRPVPHRSASELRAYLSSFGITGAAATHTHGVFYQNPQTANLELAEEIAPHRDFFLGIATLNPCYPAARRDLEFCAKELDFRALRLMPKYHGYSLDQPEVANLVAVAGEFGFPVFIPNELVNFRQRHCLEPTEPLGLSPVLELCRRFPQVNFIFAESAVPPEADYPDNLYFELSRYRSAYGGALTRLIRRVGPSRVLFGTGSPLKAAEPALLKLHHADLTPAEHTLVAAAAAHRLLAGRVD